MHHAGIMKKVADTHGSRHMDRLGPIWTVGIIGETVGNWKVSEKVQMWICCFFIYSRSSGIKKVLASWLPVIGPEKKFSPKVHVWVWFRCLIHTIRRDSYETIRNWSREGI